MPHSVPGEMGGECLSQASKQHVAGSNSDDRHPKKGQRGLPAAPMLSLLFFPSLSFGQAHSWRGQLIPSLGW